MIGTYLQKQMAQMDFKMVWDTFSGTQWISIFPTEAKCGKFPEFKV